MLLFFTFFFPFSAHLTHFFFFFPPLGSSFVVSEGSYLDISDWLNPAKLSLYYQINATSPWVRDLCGQRTTDACEQLCDQETGKGGLGREKTLQRLERQRRRFVSGSAMPAWLSPMLAWC